MKKHVDATNVGCAIAFALTSAFAAWGTPDPRGFVIFGLFVLAAEVFVYLRWRMSVVCSMCGFDPVLYKRSPARASDRVKEFFKEQVENPEFWLTKSPLLKVQKRIRANERVALDIQIMNNRLKNRTTSVAPSKSL